MLNAKSSSKSPEIEVVKADSTKTDTATVIQKLITFQELDVSFFFLKMNFYECCTSFLLGNFYSP